MLGPVITILAFGCTAGIVVWIVSRIRKPNADGTSSETDGSVDDFDSTDNDLSDAALKAQAGLSTQEQMLRAADRYENAGDAAAALAARTAARDLRSDPSGSSSDQSSDFSGGANSDDS